MQALHFFTVPETRTTILMNRIAKKRRKEGNPNIWGPDELVPFKDRFSVKEVLITWIRPFRMFLTEPIVLVLSLLSGFSDALVFMFIQSFSIVYKQWNFTTIDIGLSFIPIGVGYFIAWGLFIPAIRRNIKERQAKPNDERAQYESRLWWLLYTAPCLPIGLFGFAWTILGPPVHWIGSMIFAAIIGIANYSIYMATIGVYPRVSPRPSPPSNLLSDYMICAYGPYSASATGGNGWSRDFLAGVLTVPATPFFTNIGKSSGLNLEYASTILACISTILVIAVYLIYYYGPTLRERSPFAQQLANARNEQQGRRVSTIAGLYGSSRRASKSSCFYQGGLPCACTDVCNQVTRQERLLIATPASHDKAAPKEGKRGILLRRSAATRCECLYRCRIVHTLKMDVKSSAALRGCARGRKWSLDSCVSSFPSLILESVV